MKKIAAALTLGLSLIAAPAFAGTLVVNGTTTLDDPTYHRPISGGGGLSGNGTAAHYEVTEFSVSQDGAYDFLLTGDTPASWDTFLSLYASFDPSSALTNLLVANDDFPSIGRSGFTANLLAGASYFAVVTGFSNNSVGAYTLTIAGDGTVTGPGGSGGPGGPVGGVPEPSAWALMILGFGATGALLRRRQGARSA